MGNDGGSIPKRRELVKEAARNPTSAELKEAQQEQQDHLWNVDPLTNRPLSHPIVSDCLGRLFSKDSIIEFLLPATDENSARRIEQEELLDGRVRSLKDVVEVRFVVEPIEGIPLNSKNGHVRAERWICPITTKDLGPATKSVYLVPCGHAFSEVAVKEISRGKCLQCDEPHTPDDIIPILSKSDVDLARLASRSKTLAEKKLSHSLRKLSDSSKKRKKEVIEKSARTATVESKAVTKLGHGEPVSVTAGGPILGVTTSTAPAGIKNAATASITAKVLEEQEELSKRRKVDRNHNINSLFSGSTSGSTNGKGKNADFMTRGFAIPAHQQKR